MKLWITLIFAAILTVPAPVQKQPSKQPFTIVLTAEPKASLDSGIWVKYCYTNTSDRDLDASANILDAQNVDPNFHFELLDKEGRPVPMKVYSFPETATGHARFGTLKPGESITQSVNLVRLFELKQPGRYTVQASRLITKELGGGTVKSNTITITVTE
jgi:hypothetical protein